MYIDVLAAVTLFYFCHVSLLAFAENALNSHSSTTLCVNVGLPTTHYCATTSNNGSLKRKYTNGLATTEAGGRFFDF